RTAWREPRPAPACSDRDVFACCATRGKVPRQTKDATLRTKLLRINATDIHLLPICSRSFWLSYRDCKFPVPSPSCIEDTRETLLRFQKRGVMCGETG